MLPLILAGLAGVLTVLELLYRRFSNHSKERVLTILLKYVLFFNVGVMGLLAFFAHTIMADETAREIGWAPGSPFQSEIAFANLAFGILGILCLWRHGDFWLATGVGNAAFLLGAACVHILQLMQGNTAPYNAGVFVWVGDVLIPIFYLILLYYYFHTDRPEESKPGNSLQS